jgi:hypothetical protein
MTGIADLCLIGSPQPAYKCSWTGGGSTCRTIQSNTGRFRTIRVRQAEDIGAVSRTNPMSRTLILSTQRAARSCRLSQGSLRMVRNSSHCNEALLPRTCFTESDTVSFKVLASPPSVRAALQYRFSLTGLGRGLGTDDTRHIRNSIGRDLKIFRAGGTFLLESQPTSST